MQMRSVNFNEVEATTEGSTYQQLPAGAYVCSIMAMEDFADKEYVRMTVDIIQGEHANYFSDKFYADKPWSHSIVLSYKDKALGMLKGRLQTIAGCNPGFDPEAAWNAGNLNMFVGKAVGVVFRAEEYLDKKTGEFKIGSPRPDRMCLLTDLMDPKNADPLPKTLKDDVKRQMLKDAGFSPVLDKSGGAAPQVDLYAEDVPF